MGVELAFLAVGTGLSLLGQRSAKRAAARTQDEQLAFDAKSAKLQGKALVEEAELESLEIEREGVLIGKAQKALTAKAGLKIGTGTAEEIQEQTRFLTAKDVSTVLESAQRKKEQLEETFGVGTSELVSAERLGELKAFEKKRSEASASFETFDESAALLEGTVSRNNNFVQSKPPKKDTTVITGL